MPISLGMKSTGNERLPVKPGQLILVVASHAILSGEEDDVATASLLLNSAGIAKHLFPMLAHE